MKKKRIERGMTQKQLAALTGLSQSVISRYENGTRRPAPEHAMIIAEILGFDWTEFYMKEDE